MVKNNVLSEEIFKRWSRSRPYQFINTLSVFPEKWEIAKLKPVFRKELKTDHKYPLYWEKIKGATMHMKTQDFLDSNDLL